MKRPSFAPIFASLALLAVLAAAPALLAQDTIVPVPHNPAGATASGNDLIAAVNGITGASSVRRFVVQLSGGIYDIGTQTVTLPSYVSLRGLGSKSTTVRGKGGASVADPVVEVNGSQEVQVSELRIIAQGSGFTNAVGLLVVFSQSVLVKDVSVTSTGAGTINDGILINGSTNVGLEYVSASGINGDTGGLGIAIENASTNIKLSNVRASGLDNATNNEGILIINSQASIRDSALTARGGTGDTFGLLIRGGFQSGSTVLPVSLENVTILATSGEDPVALGLRDSSLTNGDPVVEAGRSSLVAAGSAGRGIFLDGLSNGAGASVIVENSKVQGTQAVVDNEYDLSSVELASSTLAGGPMAGFFAANVQCAASVDEALTFFATGCP